LKRNVLRALALILVIVVAMGVAGVVAYHFGATTGPNTPMMGGFGGRRGGMAFGSDGSGFGFAGLLGFLGLVVIGVLFFWLLAAFLSPDHGRPVAAGPVAAGPVAGTPAGAAATPAAGDVERLRELSDLHSAGRLTDDEFTAAKRKLLGM
jgi:predicted lipid-binding transport protein (Tim44 family)